MRGDVVAKPADHCIKSCHSLSPMQPRRCRSQIEPGLVCLRYRQHGARLSLRDRVDKVPFLGPRFSRRGAVHAAHVVRCALVFSPRHEKTCGGLLPVGFQQRLRPQLGEFEFGGLARFFSIVASIPRASLHLLWDSFTHPYTWPWRHSAFLRHGLSPVAGWTPVYESCSMQARCWDWLPWQYGSSCGIATRAPVARTAPSQPQSRFSLALIMFAIAVAVGFFARRFSLACPRRSRAGIGSC